VPNGISSANLPLFADTPAPFLAVTADARVFQEVSRAELDGCQHFGSPSFCTGSKIYARRTTTSGLLGLYKLDAPMIRSVCKWRVVQDEDFAVQVNDSTFLIYQAVDSSVKLKCGIESNKASFQGLKRVTVPLGCRLFTASFEMDGAGSFSVPLSGFKETLFNYSEIWDWGLLEDPGVMGNWLHDLGGVGSADGLTLSNFSDRHYRSHLAWYWGWVITMIIILLMIIMGFIAWKVWWEEDTKWRDRLSFCKSAPCLRGRPNSTESTTSESATHSITPEQLKEAIQRVLLEHIAVEGLHIPRSNSHSQ
jgi:hypothetical protein